MPIQIVRNDITQMRVDAIVNAANRQLAGGSGVNGAIRKAAGPELDEACRRLGGCKTGEAKMTPGYGLPCKYVIHTVGPVWHGGFFGEKARLISCYRQSLRLAMEHGCKTIAFPLISSGVFGYPQDRALMTAMEAISAFLMENDAVEELLVYVVIYSKEALRAGNKLFAGIEQYIDDHYVETHADANRQLNRWEDDLDDVILPSASPAMDWRAESAASAPLSLEEALGAIDESFADMVLRKIREKGMKNAECYKRANLDKKLFSKINNDRHYRPKKATALALAIALELDLEETRELLMKAGMALSHSDKFDIIVEYFIKQGRYNIFEINEVLFYYDQPLLGAAMQ